MTGACQRRVRHAGCLSVLFDFWFAFFIRGF
jgi:hypothetical protein